MSMRLKWLRVILLAVASAIGACLSVLFAGGFLVFGFRNFLEFCLFFIPALAFPVTLVAWVSSRIATVLFALMVILFYGAQLRLVGLSFHQLALNHTHSLGFGVIGVLLATLWAIDSALAVRVSDSTKPMH